MHTHDTVTASTDRPSIMARLKTETLEHHMRAERHPFMAAMIQGRLPVASYAEHLQQMLLVHEGIESALDRARSTHSWASVIEPWQFQADNFRADIAHFGGTITPVAADATQRLIDRIREAEHARPIELLGMHYVTEGSKNGAVFIARVLRKVYNLTPGEGDRSLDPYGPAQRERWAWFKQAVDGLPLTPADREAVIEGAKAMFDGITAIAEEQWQRAAHAEMKPAASSPAAV